MRLAMGLIVVLAVLLAFSIAIFTSSGCVGRDMAPLNAPVVNAPTSRPAGTALPDISPELLDYLAGIREVQAELQSEQMSQAGLVNAIAKVEASLARVDAKFTVGGGGDSVTAWVYAVGGLGLVAWLAYPLVWRPIRRKIEGARTDEPKG